MVATPQDPATHLHTINPALSRAVADARGTLAGLRRRAWWWLVLGRVSMLMAITLVVVLQAAFIDYFLRGPAWLRAGLWLASAAALILAIHRWVLPATQFWPSLVDLALRLERTPEGARAGLDGVLASGLEMGGLEQGQSAGSSRATAIEPSPVTQGLQAQAIAQAVDRLKLAGGSGGGGGVNLLKPGLARQSLLVLLAMVAGLAGLRLLVGGELMRIGAMRILVPIASVDWPKRTALADATDDRVRALGQTLELRAVLTKTDRDVGRTRVWVNYQVLDGEGSAMSAPVRMSLTSRGPQRELRSPEPATKSDESGELFEALVEPKLLVGTLDPAGEALIEYWFETGDDATSSRRVRLTQPPEVKMATATITPPAYAAAIVAQGRTTLVQGTADLGPGTDARAALGPVLAGSQVDLVIDFTKPVPMGGVDATQGSGEPPSMIQLAPEQTAAWLARMFPGTSFPASARAELEPARWTLRWTLDQSTRLAVSPVDEHGVTGTREAVYSFESQPDQPPTVAISKPREDETVLASALVEITGEAKDDVSVASLALERTLARGKAGSMGASPEPEPSPETFGTWTPTDDDADATTTPGDGRASRAGASLSASLDLAPLNLQPGDEVWVVALARDLFEANGVPRKAARSQPRKLRIITPQALIDQVRSGLAIVRESAIKLDEEQAKLQQAVQRGVVTAGERQRQAALGPRLQQQRESIERLQERAQRNRLDDAGLQGVLEDAQSALDQAQRASDRATARLEEAARGEDPAELEQTQQQDVAGQQEAVREELGELIRSLDRGQDNWLVRRDLERLLQQQRELSQQTERLAAETTGKSLEDLSGKQRSELGAIAERQEQLADQAMRVIDELAERAEQLKKTDPSQSQAMRQAAQRGRQQQVQRALEQAAQQLEQNQTNTAQDQQQRAQQAIEQMLGDIDQAQPSREQALKRTLESLVESIRSLIQAQERELAIAMRLIEAPGEAGAKPESGMVRLHTNTLAAADQAATAREMSGVQRLLGEAGEKQVQAIQSLRAAPMQPEVAKASEEASLSRLNEALAEAERLEQQAEQKDQNRQRQELRQAYREALELQAMLRAETQGFVGNPIDRRERLKVRVLGDRQDAIRAQLEDLRSKTTEIDEAKLFAFAHDRLNGVTASASKRLRSGKADAQVLRDEDSAIAVLKSLVEALARDPKQDEFRESPGGEQGGGGGSGQQGQPPSMLPPIAELKLLRAMQQEAAERTKLAGDAAEPGAGDDELAQDLAEEIEAIGEFQRRLAVEGAEVVEKVMQQQVPPGQGEPEDPALPPEGQP
jgi:hypothetical protein